MSNTPKATKTKRRAIAQKSSPDAVVKSPEVVDLYAVTNHNGVVSQHVDEQAAIEAATQHALSSKKETQVIEIATQDVVHVMRPRDLKAAIQDAEIVEPDVSDAPVASEATPVEEPVAKPKPAAKPKKADAKSKKPDATSVLTHVTQIRGGATSKPSSLKSAIAGAKRLAKSHVVDVVLIADGSIVETFGEKEKAARDAKAKARAEKRAAKASEKSGGTRQLTARTAECFDAIVELCGRPEGATRQELDERCGKDRCWMSRVLTVGRHTGKEVRVINKTVPNRKSPLKSMCLVSPK